nr:diflavin flavoprotein [Gloeothece citriformis]
MSTLSPTRPRDVQVANLATNTTIIRSRTWDRLKFEVEYARQKGTTANSYLIKSDRIALIDPPGESFTQIFLEELQQHLPLNQLDYIILGHVNPNRMATVKVLIQQAPQVKLICSKPAAKLLKNAFPEWESQIQIVRSEDTLDLGGGHQLQFIFVPTPRWADGLCTYDPQSRILYTDKLFGVHLCDDVLYDEDWKQLDQDRRYYFDCIHAAQAKQVESALDKLGTFTAKYYAPGHGPVVRYSLSRLTYDYRQWCQQQKTQELKVALFYASAYGNTATLANAIAQGLVDNGIAVDSINCELADPAQMSEAIENCDGFLIGSPTLGGHAPVQIQTALGIILASAAKTKLAGVFGSYGWSGEAIDLLEEKLRDANYRFGFESIRVKFTPDEPILQQCQEAGANFAQALKNKQKMRVPRSPVTEGQADRTEQALGRIIGSLSVLTTRRGERDQGFLTAWVSQASFNPPGLMIALGEQQGAEALIEPGTQFVLNILQEGRTLRRHFSFNVSGENTFPDVETQRSTNGCLILSSALAYLECTVQQRMASGDHWLIYAVVNKGEVLERNGVTAIWQRKSGSCY